MAKSQSKSKKKGKGRPKTVGQNLDAVLQTHAFITNVQLNKSRRRPRKDDEEPGTDSHDEGEHELRQIGYEETLRSFEKGKQTKKKDRLPLKTREGIIQHVEAESEEEEEEEERQDEGSGSEGERGSDSEHGGNKENETEDEEEEQKPPSKAVQRQQILEAKEELAHIALTLNEGPEENVRHPLRCPTPPWLLTTPVQQVHLLRRLREISQSRNPTVKKLALATQLSVYKSIIPGYRIRPLSAEEQSAKVTKEVKKLRGYEQSLVHSYQQYVETLAKLSRGRKQPKAGNTPARTEANKADLEIAHIAVTCAAGLVLGVPHFNFRTELLKILIDTLSKRSVNTAHQKARKALEELFRTDEDGTASLDSVQQLVKMFKTKHYRIHESVLNTFLHLRLLSELDAKASDERVDRKDNGEESVGKKRKRGDDPKKAFKTKRQKKMEKEANAAMKDLKEADAVVSHEERERMQSETLKLVFGVYFRILKERPEGNLMGATLEGLAR